MYLVTFHHCKQDIRREKHMTYNDITNWNRSFGDFGMWVAARFLVVMIKVRGIMSVTTVLTRIEVQIYVCVTWREREHCAGLWFEPVQ